ncbi:MAG: CRISPR-associated endonuclease Cas3'' [Candidatus Altiarchaeales archaeon A3]|nr:MAG: CRISPR-associated endonuclease Cas3'' [Candidatus Altiarchaeales archaeon A3]
MKNESFSFKLESHTEKHLIDHISETINHADDLFKNFDLDVSQDEKQILRQTLKLICAAHDFGKASTHFQDKLHEKEHNKKLSRHGLISALFGLFLFDRIQSENSTDIPTEILRFFVFKSIKRHHGNFELDELSIPREADTGESSLEDIERIYDNIEENHQEEVDLIYNQLLNTLGVQYVEEFGIYISNLKNKIREGENELRFFPKFQLKGCDPFYFYLFNLFYSILIESDKKSASKTEVERISFSPSEDFISKFKEKFDFNIEFNKEREKIYKRVMENLDGEIGKGLQNRFLTIGAPTGSGKTLIMFGAAFKLREYMKKQHSRDYRIIYALPFISIIEQNYNIIEQVLKKNLNKDKIGNEILIAHHHLADEVFKTSGTEEKSYSESSFLIESWYSEIVVTTFYQLFKSVFTNQNHLLKKYNKLINSIIIIDEIQAVPPHLLIIIKQFLKIMTERFNSIIILGTATEPEFNGKYEEENEKLYSKKLFDFKSLNDETKDRYFNRYRINTTLLKEKLNNEKLIEELEKSAELNNFIIVLNTIRSTKEIYCLISENPKFKEYELIYLSTNIPPSVRLKRIKRINGYLFIWDDIPGSDSERLIDYLMNDLKISWTKNAEIKKNDTCNTITVTKDENSLEIKLNDKEDEVILKISSREIHKYLSKKENGKISIYEYSEKRKKFIVLTTQLIEAGVDISVQRIFRDLAPLDSIVQTAGRTNRSNEMDTSDVFIFELADKENKTKSFSSYVYDKILLNKTRELLKEKDIILEKEMPENYLPRYFKFIINNIAQGYPKNKYDPKDIKKLIEKQNHYDLEKCFKLIENTDSISIFVVIDQNDSEIWNKYKEIKQMKVRTIEDFQKQKEAFSKIKRKFNKQIVTLNIYSENKKNELKTKLDFKKQEKVGEIYAITKESDLYNEITGLKLEELDKNIVWMI